MSQTEFFKTLFTILDQSTITYRQYLDAGKIFQYAQVLKLLNSRALQLLTDNKDMMPQDLQKDIEYLIIHYTEWSLKWEKLAAEKEHQPDDVFVFANEINFPKQAAQNLETVYKKLNPPPATPQKK